ncbi:Gfo/Idh/MocA family protein [Halocatena halophila]|uniref:Gfo/Idh/MocA family protein n=1 Tax=Halocatena halophila TaxID=2814576 RepID=UPI002ED11F80
MTLDVGVLGYRFMGRAHANALSRLEMFFPDAPATNRTVLIGRDAEALEEAADRLGFDSTATDWEDALDEIDVLYNLGPNHVHVEPSIAALEAGVSVLCEKPLAPTLSDAKRMADSARQSSATAGIAFNYRFVPAIQYARNLIADGALGTIRHVRARYLQDWLVDPEAPWSWRLDESLAGSGALGDLGAHSIDLVRFLLGEQVGPIERLSGQLTTFVDERPVAGEDETRPVTVDDAYSAQVTFDSGATGLFEASRFANGHDNDNTVVINGSAGSLRFSLERLNELELLTGDDRGYQTVLVTDPDDPYVEHWWPPGHVLGWEHTFVHENYEFLSAVRDNDTFTPDFHDGLAVQRIMDAIQRSDREGTWIKP